MSKPFEDEFIAGWTDEDVEAHFGFDSLTDEIRYHTVPISPFSICREVRRGVAGFTVADMRQGARRQLRVKTKRAATRIAKIIEQDAYAPHPLPAGRPSTERAPK